MTRPTQSPAAALVPLLIAVTAGPAAADLVVTVGADFDGTDLGQSGFRPPDTMGGVGRDHVVELINGQYAVYDRTGATLRRSSLDRFWQDAGVAPDSFSFDPRVIYEARTDRWFAAAVDNVRVDNRLLVAVSNTGNPLDGWRGYGIDSDSDDGRWADFPMLGVTDSTVTVSANMFDAAGGSFNSTQVSALVIDKAALLGGAFNPVSDATLVEDFANTTGFTPQPVFDTDGSLGAGPGHTLLSAFNKPAGFLRVSEVDAAGATGGSFVNVTGRADPRDASQGGTNVLVDTSNTRFSGNVVARDGTLWAAHTVDVDGRAAVEWYQIDPLTGDVLQSGLIADDSLAFSFPSIAVNEFGDVVIGFSGSDANTFISTYAAVGETVGGVTTFNAPLLLKAGEGSYVRPADDGRNRWGDYSATVVDPLDPRSFWTFQEYASAGNNWSVRITQLNLAPAPVPEPTTWLLIGLAACGAGVRRRRCLANAA